MPELPEVETERGRLAARIEGRRIDRARIDDSRLTRPDEPGWIGIGYVTAEPGGLLLLISVVLAGIGARRLAKGRGADWLTRSATVLVLVVLAAYLVALWAMTAKPD